MPGKPIGQVSQYLYLLVKVRTERGKHIVQVTTTGWSQYLYLLVKVRTCGYSHIGGSHVAVAIPIPSGEGQNVVTGERLVRVIEVSQYLYLLVKVRT